MALDRDRTIRMFSLRVMALIEGVTLALLVGVAVPLKHLAGYPGVVSLLGPVHGMVFIFYLWMVVNTVSGDDWSRGEIARVLLAALVPGGAFFNADFMRRKEAELLERVRP